MRQVTIRQHIHFLIVLERTKFKSKLNLRQKFRKGLGSPIIDVSDTKDSEIIIHTLIFWNCSGLAWQCSGKEGD